MATKNGKNSAGSNPARANGKTAEKADAGISNLKGLIRSFEKLVDAVSAIASAATKRDAAKKEADVLYTEETVEATATVELLHGACLDYCIAHKEEVCEPGKKSGIVGPVTVEFELGGKTLVTTGGKTLDEKWVIIALQDRIGKSKGATKALYEACIVSEPKLKKNELKKLPEDVLKDLGLKLYQPETVSWKPNAER